MSGPKLSIVGTCEGCPHLSRNWHYDECRHPNGKANHAFADLPAWCPLLAAAKERFARELVGEGRPIPCPKCGKPVSLPDEGRDGEEDLAHCRACEVDVPIEATVILAWSAT